MAPAMNVEARVHSGDSTEGIEQRGIGRYLQVEVKKAMNQDAANADQGTHRNRPIQI